MTLKFAKKLPTLGIHYKAIPDPEPTLPEGLLPDLTKESTHHYYPDGFFICLHLEKFYTSTLKFYTANFDMDLTNSH